MFSFEHLKIRTFGFVSNFGFRALTKENREENLVIALCRLNLTEEEKATLDGLLRLPLSWDTVFRKACQEGVLALAYRHLSQPGYKEKIPEDILQGLRNNYYVQVVRNTLILNEAKEIITTLAARGIQGVILKGIFLAQEFYRDIGLRPVTDIDLLIRREDRVGANEALTTLGYIPPAYYGDLLKIKKTLSVNTFMYRKPNGNFYLHLHWHIINATWPLDSLVERIDMARIWESAHPVGMDGVDVLSLSPQHLLIYLIFHAFMHSFERRILSCDIMEAIKFYGQGFDWNEVREEAKRFGLSGIIERGLFYARRNLDSPSMRPPLSYFVFLGREEGVLRKIKFLAKTAFPSRYVLAHNLDLAFAQIRPQHYWQRITGKLAV